MSKRDGIGFVLSGAMVWAGLTLAYLGFVDGEIPPSPWHQGVNLALVATALSLFIPIAARLGRTPRPERAPMALAFAAPGLIASAALALNTPTLLPDLTPEALARYVALALAAGALVLLQAVAQPSRRA